MFVNVTYDTRHEPVGQLLLGTMQDLARLLGPSLLCCDEESGRSGPCPVAKGDDLHGMLLKLHPNALKVISSLANSLQFWI